MKKTYWVMKNCGQKTEWIEMNGMQFYEFITSPAGKGRYFMDCETYKIEVSPAQYRRWKVEKNHCDYLQEFENQVVILPFERLLDISGYSSAELIPDPSINVEDEALNNIDLKSLSKAILLLTDKEKWLITELFMRDNPKTEQEIAALTSVSQQAIHKQKNKILKKLKMLVVKS